MACREGEQVLYPSFQRFVTDWKSPITDTLTAGTMRSPVAWWPNITSRYPDHTPIEQGGLTRTQELIALHPEERIPFRPKRRGLKADVLIGVRRRDFSPEKNWNHYQQLADALRAEGISYAVVGDRASSFDLDGMAWTSADYDTDAAIEGMQNCRLFVSSDTGTAHLAAAVGCRQIVFALHNWKHRNMVPNMEAVNNGNVQYVADGWENPTKVIDAMMQELTATALN